MAFGLAPVACRGALDSGEARLIIGRSLKRFLVVILLLGSTLGARAFTGTNVNGIVAIVNQSVITLKDLDLALDNIRTLLVRQYGRDRSLLQQKLMAAQQNQIEELVARQLILHEFKTAGYNLPDSFVEDAVKRDIRQQFGDRLHLTQTLQEQGDTFESYRDRIRERFIIEAMYRKNVNSEIMISPHKMEAYYQEHQDKYKLEDQVKLRMIVITNRVDAVGEAKKLGEEILAKLKEGAPFAEMATVYSESSQSKEGGNWGWVERSVLRKELGDIAFTLKPGQRSGVIELPDACYLMLVEDSRVSHVRPISEVRSDIEKTLSAEEHERLRKQWIQKLKAKSFIRYF